MSSVNYPKHGISIDKVIVALDQNAFNAISQVSHSEEN